MPWLIVLLVMMLVPVSASAEDKLFFGGGGPVMHLSEDDLQAGLEVSAVLIPDYDSDVKTLLPLWASAGVRGGVMGSSGSVYGEIGVWAILQLGIGVEATFGRDPRARINLLAGIPFPVLMADDAYVVVASPYRRSIYDLRDRAWTEEYGLSLKVLF